MTKEYAPYKRNFRKINMNMNENPFDLNITIDVKKVNRYERPIALKKKISEMYGINENNVVIGSGSDQLLKILGEVVIKKEDSVALMAPFFPRTKQHLSINCNKVAIIQPNDDLSYNLSEINDSFSYVFFASPNNPTGKRVGIDSLEELLERYRNTIFVIDEALEFYNYTYTIELTKKYNNLNIIRSLSKNFGLAGERVGFLITNNKEILEKINAYISPFPISKSSELLALYIINSKDYLENYVANVKRELPKMIKELNRIGVETVSGESSNFLIDAESLGYSSSELCELLDKRFDIIVTDAKKAFSLKKEYVRVSISTPYDNEIFIDAIREIAKELKKQSS